MECLKSDSVSLTEMVEQELCVPEEDVGIRYYGLQERVEEVLHGLSEAELDGATKVLTELYSFLDDLHFTEKRVLNRRAFVKTMEELFEVCCEEICARTQNGSTGGSD
jgi:hypothetical protein